MADHSGPIASRDKLKKELEEPSAWNKSTLRYVRYALGLSRMTPPSLEDLDTAYRSLAGEDLSIIQAIRNN